MDYRLRPVVLPFTEWLQGNQLLLALSDMNFLTPRLPLAHKLRIFRFPAPRVSKGEQPVLAWSDAGELEFAILIGIYRPEYSGSYRIREWRGK